MYFKYFLIIIFAKNRWFHGVQFFGNEDWVCIEKFCLIESREKGKKRAVKLLFLFYNFILS